MAASKSGSNIGSAAGAIREYVRRGLSARKAIQEFRAAGGSMRDSYFRKQYGTIRDAMARSTEISQLPGHRIPGTENFAPWRAGKGGQFAYQVPIMSRDVGTGIITERQWTVMSDRAISINKALRMAQADFDAGVADKYSDEVFLSATVTGLYKTIGADDA